jgi:hypothetical protein
MYSYSVLSLVGMMVTVVAALDESRVNAPSALASTSTDKVIGRMFNGFSKICNLVTYHLFVSCVSLIASRHRRVAGSVQSLFSIASSFSVVGKLPTTSGQQR